MWRTFSPSYVNTSLVNVSLNLGNGWVITVHRGICIPSEYICDDMWRYYNPNTLYTSEIALDRYRLDIDPTRPRRYEEHNADPTYIFQD